MATLIPSISTCKFDTTGERAFANLLEAKLEEDYLCWYNVPIGKARQYPDFVILHPQRGLIILEVKDWLLDTIHSIDTCNATLLVNGGQIAVKNPLEQARNYALSVADILKRDPQLVWAEGRFQGKLVFPWTFGVVLTKITRKEFDSTDLGDVIDPNRVICKDEMVKSIDSLKFQEQLWGMFTIYNQGMLTLPQIDRVRYHLFPEIRLPHKQASLFDGVEDEPESLPDILRVMDIQQEQLARSLGDGHRVIHGVAGSGKTMILGYRAEYLAQVSKAVLVLCYNKMLADRLKYWIQAKGIADKVHVHTFHSWCLKQLKAYNIEAPHNNGNNDQFYDDLVDTVIREVDRKFIPAGQYDAVMIDEGHDFRSEWLKLVVQMVNPQSNSLLVLYDDAQSLYDTRKKGKFSFKSVGVQAQGRTTILRVNYRNTKEILDFASVFVQQLLTQEDADEDGIPRLSPVSAGRHGTKPLLVKFPTIHEEADEIAKRLREAHDKGIPWRDMAVLYWDAQESNELYRAFCDIGIPFVGKEKLKFSSQQDRVSFLSYYSCKGLEFPLVGILGGRIIEQAKTNADAAKQLYVGMTRATSLLVMTAAESARSVEAC